MTLPDLKALDKLIALCRKRGVKTVKLGDLELTLGDDAPAPQRRSRAKAASPESSLDEIESFDMLSDEEKMFWSASGGESGGESDGKETE